MAAKAVAMTSLVCLLALALALQSVSVSAATQHAPAPAVDCSSLILNMADCLSYVSNGSTVAKPEGTCCTGLKTVLKADAECLCEAFKSSADLGVVLNVTKAISLPAACKVSAPSAANCALSITPARAPALSPSEGSSPGSTPMAPGTETGIGSANVLSPAPAPSPGSSGSATLSASVGSLLVGLVVASFSGF